MRTLRFVTSFLCLAIIGPVTSVSADEPAPLDAALVESPRSNRAALFTDELALLERAVVGWLETRDDLRVRLLPPDTRASLEAPVCAAPMHGEDVIRQRFGRVARVSITAECVGDPPCELRVRVQRPPVADGAYERIHEWRAEVPSGAGQITRFIGAVAALAEPPPPPTGGLFGTLGEVGDTPPVTVEWARPAGRWRTAPTPLSIAESQQAALDACHAPGWSSATNDTAVLAFEPDGSVARCEALLRREPIDEARAQCLCRALSTLRVERGAPGRRVQLGLMNHPGSGVLAGEVTHYARFETTGTTGGFRAYPGLGDVREPVARCFAMAGVTGLTRIGLRVVADGTGAMTRAEIDGTGLSPEISRCLQGVLTPMTFTCPATMGEATWSGAIVAYTRPN